MSKEKERKQGVGKGGQGLKLFIVLFLSQHVSIIL